MSDAASDGSRALIRLCAVATLVMACTHLPPAVFGTVMAVMNGPGFLALIGLMLLLVVTGLGLSVRALVRPRWRSVLLAAICLLPATIVYSWLLG